MDSELNYASWPGADLRSTGQLYFELLNAMLEVELKGGVRMRLRWMSPSAKYSPSCGHALVKPALRIGSIRLVEIRRLFITDNI